MTELSINGDRLIARLKALGEIGRRPDGGRTRLAYTPEDREGRAVVMGWMREAGLDIHRDPIGNLFAAPPGAGPAGAIMSGSHLDTVGNAGHLDGPLGVLAAIAAIETLKEAGRETARPIIAAIFANEEGVRFQPDMMGSLVHAGGLPLEDALSATDGEGTALSDALQPEPGTLAVEIGHFRPAAFVELHIEQGPVLENAGETIGIVEGVQGIFWAEITVTGSAGHAGTTPRNLRQDAGLAAMQFAAGLPDALRELGDAQLITVGGMELQPGMINVIARQARLTLDLRNPDPQGLKIAIRLAEAHAREVETATGAHIAFRELVRLAPVRFDADLCRRIETLARRRGFTHRRMISGAGHDAQMMARMAPSAMIFVPSKDGISHNPNESTEDADIIAGANLLLDTLVELAG